MKFSNLVRTVTNMFRRTRTAIKQQIIENNEPVMVRSITDPKKVLVCGGSPIPFRLINQRQRRKLTRQTR